MRDKGILWWKKRWYSYCSMYREYKDDLCNLGSYEYICIEKIYNFLSTFRRNRNIK